MTQSDLVNHKEKESVDLHTPDIQVYWREDSNDCSILHIHDVARSHWILTWATMKSSFKLDILMTQQLIAKQDKGPKHFIGKFAIASVYLICNANYNVGCVKWSLDTTAITERLKGIGTDFMHVCVTSSSDDDLLCSELWCETMKSAAV